MLINEDPEFNSDDLESVKSRLNEQSELIMLLKQHADREMQVAREYEMKLSQEEERNDELRDEIQELRARLSQSQQLVSALSESVDQINLELIQCRTNSRTRANDCVDAGVNCDPIGKKESANRSSQTTDHWMELKEIQQLQEDKLYKADESIRKYQEEISQLQKLVDSTRQSMEDQVLKLISSKTVLEQRCQEKDNECAVLRLSVTQLESNQEARIKEFQAFKKENDLMLRDLEKRLEKSEKSKRALQEELKRLKKIRKEEIDMFNVNTQVQKMRAELEAATERHNELLAPA